MDSKRLRRMIIIAMLGSIATILMKFNFPLPALPTFLKFDFGEIPAVIAVMTMGPIAGIVVELIKNILYWFLSGSPTGIPVGEMANFTTGILFIMPIYFIYNKFRTTKGLAAGLVAGTVTMAVGMSVLNYFVFFPMYTYFLNMPMATGEALYKLVILGVLPFNLVRGLITMALTILLFSKLKKWIEQQRVKLSAE